MLADVPDMPGVYALWQDEDLIYVGNAFGGTLSLRTCLAEHVFGVRSMATYMSTECAWEVSIAPAQREKDLLEEYRAQHGRVPRCNESG
jgi:excinuclease UvrABC nuclease subunit